MTSWWNDKVINSQGDEMTVINSQGDEMYGQ
jgi:hypothetical protein